MKKLTSEYTADSSGLNAAWDAIEATGGTIEVDDQEMLFTTYSNLSPATYSLVPFILRGDGSNLMKIDTGTSTDVIGLENKYGVSVRDLVFITNSSPLTLDEIDCKNVFWLRYCHSAVFERTHFVSLKASESLIKAGEECTRLVVKHSRLEGCAAPALIKTTHGSPVTIDDIVCWDNGSIVTPTVFGKTSHGMGSWIDLRGGATSVGARHSTADIKNSRFDEGADPHIYIEDYRKIEVAHCGFGLQATAGATGMHFKNADHVTVKHSNSGFATSDVPFLKLENVTKTIVGGHSIDTSVYRIEADSVSAAGLKVLNSPGVTVTIV